LELFLASKNAATNGDIASFILDKSFRKNAHPWDENYQMIKDLRQYSKDYIGLNINCLYMLMKEFK
jgi:hypothetical protein